MKGYQKYRIAIGILSFLVIIQGVFIFILTRPRKIPPVPAVIKGKIAMVIDDWGYSLNNLPILDRMSYPLTMAVLPNLNYSQVLAREFHQRGFEIILHLPMEPHEKFRLEKNTIMASMDEPTIRKILVQDLTSVPYVKGVSNHMGSKATEDSRAMEVIFKELKRRRLYFLDSLVSSESICFDLSHKMHLDFAERSVFLDNREEQDYIKGQIYKLKMRAKFYGQAIGIGHDRKITLEVLKEAIPNLQKEGYKFVFVSELVK